MVECSLRGFVGVITDKILFWALGWAVLFLYTVVNKLCTCLCRVPTNNVFYVRQV
jgi:hypothetical protein